MMCEIAEGPEAAILAAGSFGLCNASLHGDIPGLAPESTGVVIDLQFFQK
jgi:hypothetical protein